MFDKSLFRLEFVSKINFAGSESGYRPTFVVNAAETSGDSPTLNQTMGILEIAFSFCR